MKVTESMPDFKNITIDNNLNSVNLNVIAYTIDVENNTTSVVEDLINKTIEKIKNSYKIEDVVNIPKLKQSRDAYKKLGIDPSRYRLATESLIRRIVKDKGLYRINDIVDLGNILSIETLRSVCVVDLDKIDGDVFITKGKQTDIYEGINRGIINITNMPVYQDNIGNFGTPTSDTIRTAVTSKTNKILVMIICFGTSNDDNKDEELLINLYKNYANGKNFTKCQVKIK